MYAKSATNGSGKGGYGLILLYNPYGFSQQSYPQGWNSDEEMKRV